jgi:hypothetical protein
MLPEPTLPKPPATAPALSQRQVTPLPVGDGPDPALSPGRRPRQQRPPGRDRRASSRLPAGRASRGGAKGESRPGDDPGDLLAITAQRLRGALARSFLRHEIPGDLQAAVHAAMNVIEPVLHARDTEILRLRRLMAARIPGR